MSYLEVRGLAFGYGGGFRLEEVSFELDRGEVLGVIGPNGAGKTTLVRLLSRVREPQGGTIRLDGTPLASLGRAALARRLAVVPQHTSVAFGYTVEELCLMGRYPHARGRLFEAPEDVRQARAAMARVGVLELAHLPLDALSGGERQRVFLARALAQEPVLLVLDEPTSHLDLRARREVAVLLRHLACDDRLAIFLVSQDLGLAGELADRLLLLARGRVLALGPPETVLTETVLEAAYGCPVRVDRHPVSGRPVVSARWVDEGR